MKDRKEQLQKAIITNDMEMVRDFYEYIFSEKAPKIINENPNNSGESKIYKQLINEAVLVLTRQVPPKYELSTNDNDEQVNEKPVTAKISSDSEMQFISSRDFDLPENNNPEYEKAMKSMPKKKKERRPEYKPKIIKCGGCGNDFDFNKEYPVGMLESGANGKIKCNKCRIG